LTAPTPCQKCKADLERARERIEELECEVTIEAEAAAALTAKLWASNAEVKRLSTEDCLRRPVMYLERAEAAEQKLAAANALLGRIVKYAVEDRAITPGTTRLARVLSEAEAHLANQPAEPVPFTTVQGETFTHCTMPEREVLKAVYAVPIRTLENVNPLGDWADTAKAELARRATEGQTTRDT
jgi:hypothetical protein